MTPSTRPVEVDRFLDWFEMLPADAVRAIVEGSLTREWLRAAREVGRTLTGLGVSASLRSAMDKRRMSIQSPKTQAGLRLDPKRRGMLPIALSHPLDAIVLREKLPAAEFAILTRPFREAGYDFDASEGV